MKLLLTTPMLDVSGKPGMFYPDTGGKPVPVTVRDILLQVAAAQAGDDPKKSFMLWRLAMELANYDKTEIELNPKLSDVLLKLVKHPVSPKGDPLVSGAAHAQLMLACGLTEEDL